MIETPIITPTRYTAAPHGQGSVSETKGACCWTRRHVLLAIEQRGDAAARTVVFPGGHQRAIRRVQQQRGR